tara:strand:- start:1062 stop:1517 length:456 start_codon:yes stop_codon:yes gene_type:complete
MKKIILVTALASMSTSAFADVSNVKVRDVYKTEVVQVPETETRCKFVNIPVYETYTQNGSASDAITGGIIGGVIGNQFGNGSGKDAMTVLGAILGAKVADKPRTESRITGYKQEQQCSDKTVYHTKKIKTYSHSVIEFIEDGKKYTVEYGK